MPRKARNISLNTPYLQRVLFRTTTFLVLMGILAVGTVALDSIQTPFGSVERELGGSATYVCIAAKYFTEDVRLVAVVGRDFPDEFVRVIEDSGVNIAGLETDPDGKTFAWSGKYHYDLNNRDTLSTDLNVLQSFSPVIPVESRNARIVCLGNLDPQIQCEVVDQMTAPELIVCDTMNFWIENTPEGVEKVLRKIDCLIVNDSEARQLSGEPNLIRAASAIRRMGPRYLVIKKGEHGAVLFTDDTVFSVPAYPLEDIEDPTGAGDAFMGGFAGYLAGQEAIDDRALKRALVFGSAIASFCVERFGPARLLNLSQVEILDRIQAFRALTTIPEDIVAVGLQ
jgi:sugar/nucleoside kinase (ribokinase family)